MSESEQSGAGRREVAYRLFATEFEDADYSYSESDEERAPNYVITPTGARVNRLFVVGVLTEVEQVSENTLRGRVVDPTGAFIVYAGQYQPDEQAFLDGAETPTFVAVTGKARTFQPEDSDLIYTSIRPESISEVDATTRDRWTVQTAEQTIQRIRHMATAQSLDVRGEDLQMTLEDNGVDEGLAAGIPLALDHYGTTPAYLDALYDLSLDAARVVADELDEVESLTLAPDEVGDADVSSLVDRSVEVSRSAQDVVDAAERTSGATTERSTDVEPTDVTGDATATTAEESVESTASGQSDSPTAETTTTADRTDAATAETGSDGEPAESATAQTETETTEATTSVDEESEPMSTETTATAATATTEASEGGSTSETSESADVEQSTPGASEDSETETDEDIGDFEPGEFELDDEEREETEEEFGTEFQSGTEVPELGEADIETPDSDEMAEDGTTAEGTVAESDTDTASADVTAADDESVETTAPSGSTADTSSDTDTTADPADEAKPVDASEGEPEASPDTPAAEDVDLEDAVVDVMGELDEGDGAAHDSVVETVVERHGADRSAVEDAIQDALMDGRCYEPDDATLKPI